MERNNILTRYLRIGVISLFFLTSCKDRGAYERYPLFNIVNTTDYKISIDNYPNNYHIEPNSSIVIKGSQVVNAKKNNASSYKSPYTMVTGVPLTIRFNNVKCLINQTESSEHSITNINNFIAEEIDYYTYKFTYTFTEADYNRATTCP